MTAQNCFQVKIQKNSARYMSCNWFNGFPLLRNPIRTSHCSCYRSKCLLEVRVGFSEYTFYIHLIIWSGHCICWRMMYLSMNDPHLDMTNSNHFIDESQIYPIKHKIFMEITQGNDNDVWSGKNARLVVKSFSDLYNYGNDCKQCIK